MKTNYHQILELIRQLPDTEIKKLAGVLQSEISSKRSAESIQEVVLKAPTWSNTDLEEYRSTRDHINKSRISRFF